MKEYKLSHGTQLCFAIAVIINTVSIIFAANAINKSQDRIDYLTVRLLEVMKKVDALEQK